MTPRLASAALAVALTLGATACSPGPSEGPAGATASPSPDDVQRELAAARRFAQCARDHGHPAFPDPVIEDDRVTFPAGDGDTPRKRELAALERVPECRAIMSEMGSRGSARGPARVPTAAELRRLRQLARCVRGHGVPAWPDPTAEGIFPVGSSQVGDPKSAAVRRAFESCEQYALPGFGQLS
ncbi:hypothetical protein [Sphaerisporangium aureirubrum]|uniref:Lipoprotein n=1 Tax=Sphaerisporangium aureirubrum TaxID=1544736 RepID=A0ABW1NR91_9ACTN